MLKNCKFCWGWHPFTLKPMKPIISIQLLCTFLHSLLPHFPVVLWTGKSKATFHISPLAESYRLIEPELRFLNFNFLLFEQSALSRHMFTSNKQPAGNVGTILQASYISESVKETMHDEISIALDQKKNHSLRKCTQRVRPLQLCHALAFSNSICYTSI